MRSATPSGSSPSQGHNDVRRSHRDPRARYAIAMLPGARCGYPAHIEREALVAHRRAKLTVLGRQLLVDRILVDGMAVAHAADMVGVSRQTAWKWLRRFEAEGRAGLEDRSSRPRARRGPCPRRRSTRSSPPGTSTASGRTAWRRSSACRARRSATSWPATGYRACATRTARPGSRSATSASGPASCSTSTSRSWAGSPTAAAIGSAAGSPGTPRPDGAGYDYLHVAVDDTSRVAYVAPFADERGTTCARFLLDAAAFFARHGVRIERVLTDNAKNYTRSQAFAAALAELGARHKRHPAVPAPDQRQGRAVQPDPAQRVGLRPPLRHEPGAARRPARLRRPLQPSDDPTARWTDSHR